MENKRYKLETHLHVKDTSPCAQTDEKTIAEIYKGKGYNGIVYTSHYNSYLIDYYGMTAKEYSQNFVEHYNRLKQECQKVGIDVFFGMEFMPDCTSYYNADTPYKAEFLIYGITPEFVLDGGERMFRNSVEEISLLCRENGWIFSQSHPFRTMITYRNPSLLEAVEVYNGNARQDSHNGQAEQFAKDNGLIPLAGSDFHEPQDGGAGIILENAIKDERELVNEIRKRRHLLLKQDSTK